MSEKRFIYTTRIITDKKGCCKDYIWDKGTLLHTGQVVAILNAQADYIDYVTKERNLACNKLDKLNDENKTLKKENEQLKKQNKVTSEFFVVRENDKIIALFTSERRARFYCRENLANLHYQKEEWIRKGVAYNE